MGYSTIREMHMPVSIMPNFESGFGIGWSIRRITGYKVMRHNGDLPGYTTSIILVPSLKLGVIVFTNSGGNPAEIAQKVLELLIPVFERQQDWQSVPASAEELARWQAYFECYSQVPLASHIRIEIIDNKLMLTVPGADPKTHVRLLPHLGNSGHHLQGIPAY